MPRTRQLLRLLRRACSSVAPPLPPEVAPHSPAPLLRYHRPYVLPSRLERGVDVLHGASGVDGPLLSSFSLAHRPSL